MAKNSLKVVYDIPGDARDGQLDADGYISIVQQLILDQTGLDDFDDDGDPGFTKQRTRKLVDYARTFANGTPTRAKITQLDATGAPENVSETTTRVRANKDQPKKAGRQHRRISITLPEDALSPGDLTYVDPYIELFMRVWTGNNAYVLPAPASNSTAVRAREYMFGTMLLTKCR